MAELTPEIVNAFNNADFSECGNADWEDSHIRAGLTAALPVIERGLRAAIAEEIRQALAADEADSDVTSGEAIWEQTGYRRGLADAAEIAAGGRS